jgi:spore maturation protein CgeB
MTLSIAFFGSSLVSAYWNGAATYYRGLIRNLHALGHQVTFYEPDAFDRQQHRDLAMPPWAKVVVYPATDDGVARALEQARGADVAIKASGVGVFDSLLEAGILDVPRAGGRAFFWDVDAPATLDRLHGDPRDPFRALISKYELIFTYGGGPPVAEAYRALGARDVVPIYNALDPASHHPAPVDPRFACDLAFLGHRLPDREARVEEFFLTPAARLVDRAFLLAGNAWGDKPMPPNVRWLGYVSPAEHNAFNCTPRAVLNIARDSMARYGWGPATRVFEAAGVGACLITDAWQGLEDFLIPGEECLVAASGEEVEVHLSALDERRARAIGEAARRKILAQHTYAHRAREVQAVLDGRAGKERGPGARIVLPSLEARL